MEHLSIPLPLLVNPVGLINAKSAQLFHHVRSVYQDTTRMVDIAIGAGQNVLLACKINV